MKKEVWTQRNLRLKDRHGWKAKPGYAICAINGGAIRFDYPAGWHVDADSDSLKVRDAIEPNDNCVLAVSQMHLPAEIADRVPLREIVQVSMSGDNRQILKRNDIVEVPREDGVELAYVEITHLDPNEKREAISRMAVARGSGVYCMITFDFWVGDGPKYEPMWEEAIRSLTLGVYVKDPTKGPVVQ